ncbi:phospholipid/cholesterol/gamma-HCH transport system substrate-binding protein [Thermomonospora echinospora]|uniref:Phospholipid/cholesterol/gamma-HCH transport system substrate-binding protein n=1 Tax=Thermomonospora echinospora TaxID=1992 RepID=A0A1H5Y101_9ACTN|nr:MlaD family protein [Thermomonospora echinospora]SEG17613.1 phospholipid/cholesterol/gamma-HCH transport system substrate-binding protein [Thermomonospora echinospora]
MLTLGTRLKNYAFLVLGVLVIAYIGVRYADLSRYVGVRDYYVVKVDLAQTGGLYTNADVTYRGVSVGRVGPMHLNGQGLRADLHIDRSAPKIPTNLRAVVANLSAVGEQYIDLRPETGDGPYLRNGSVIPQSATATPAPVTNLLTSLNDLAASVPLESLRTVVDEFGRAFEGQGANLQALMDTSGEFIDAADVALPSTTKLIVDGETVLRTQNEQSAALRSFAANARLLADRLGTADADLRRLITTAPDAATQLTGLVRDLDPSLSVLVANLLTTSDVALTRQRGIEELMVRLPQAVAAGSTAITPRGASFGMAVTFFSPLPCVRGYEGTTYRNGLNTSPGPAFNRAASCREPASTGKNVRGSANAPYGGGVPKARKPGSTDARVAAATGLPGALALPSVQTGATDLSGLLGLTGWAAVE